MTRSCSPSPSLLAGLVALLAVALPQDVAAQSSPEQDVMAVVKRLFDGMRAGDSAMARSAFDAMAQLVSVSPPDSAGIYHVSEAPIDRFLAAIGTAHTDVWDERIFDTEVRVDAGLASVWAKYAFYRGETLNHCGVDAFQLALRPEGWKIIQVADTRRTANCWKPPR
jgi:hypothetical protein